MLAPGPGVLYSLQGQGFLLEARPRGVVTAPGVRMAVVLQCRYIVARGEGPGVVVWANTIGQALCGQGDVDRGCCVSPMGRAVENLVSARGIKLI